MHKLFSVCSLKHDNVITSKPTWKLKQANSILEYFEHFCQMTSKSILIIFELYRFKVGAFSLRHSVAWRGHFSTSPGKPTGKEGQRYRGKCSALSGAAHALMVTHSNREWWRYKKPTAKKHDDEKLRYDVAHQCLLRTNGRTVLHTRWRPLLPYI